MPSPDFSNCSSAFDNGEVNWDVFSSCLPLPLALSLLLALSACWLFFLLVVFLRYFKNRCSAAKGMVVGKKLQILQIWFYSFLFTFIYITSLFTAATLFKQRQFISSLLLLSFTYFSLVVVTIVDVVGNDDRKSGNNAINFRIALEYALTLYLPKAVWKISAHHEEAEAFDATEGYLVSNGSTSAKKTGILSKVFGLTELNNFITPKVYDVKDVVSILCTFLSLPATLILLSTHLLSDIPLSSDNFSFLSFILFFFTSLLGPFLGDWELLTRDKKKLKSLKFALSHLFYLIKRPTEFCARGTFFVLVSTGTRGVCAILLGLEFLFMWCSHMSQFDSPRGGRVRGTFHKLYSSFAEIFFGFFRRISVDKHLVVGTNDMSPAIELVRYSVKAISTVVGFLVFITKRSVFWSESKDWIIYVSIGANVVLIALLIIEFVIMKRSDIKKADVKNMLDSWNVSCCWIFKPKVQYVDRTKPMAEGAFNLL